MTAWLLTIPFVLASVLASGCREHVEIIGRQREVDAGTLAGCVATTGAPVTLTSTATGYTVDNGLVQLGIGADGWLTQLRKSGRDLMGADQGMYVSEGPSSAYHWIAASSSEVLRPSSDLVELVFHDHQSGSSHTMDWDLHYVVQRGVSGFHYFLVARTGTPTHPDPVKLSELRTVMRLDPTIVDHGYNGERFGALPTAAQNEASADAGEPYPLTAPSILPGNSSKPGVDDRYFDVGPLYSRYDWASYRTDDRLHGLFGHGFGVWLISPSFEFYTGGPLKQDLTVHGLNVILNMYHGNHFGANTDAPALSPTKWEKLYGPNFVYVNEGGADAVRTDALQRSEAETAAWPPCWMRHEQFPLASSRGRVRGRIVEQHDRSVDRAMVVLAGSGPLLPQAYGYVYWGQADAEGRFDIAHVRPGRYSVHVFATQGLIVDDPDHGEIVGKVDVAVGDNELGTLTWSPPYHPTVLWSIGRSDRKSGEFRFTPDRPPGEPNLANQTGRTAGVSTTQRTWAVPPVDHTFRVGRDTASRDWYFAQTATGTWIVEFHLDYVPKAGAHLTLGLAGATLAPSLKVLINGHSALALDLGDDAALTRSALQGGRYQMVTALLPAEQLQIGDNLLSFVLDTHGVAGAGVYYDVLLLETN